MGNRKLTVFGKVLFAKTLALAKLNYVFSILQVPEEIVKKVKCCVFNYIWNKRDRVKRDTIIGKNSQGGLNMIDIESKISALKCAWIPRLLYMEGNWKTVFEEQIDNMNLNLDNMIKADFRYDKKLPTNFKLNDFYKEVFIFFNGCKNFKVLGQMSDDTFLSQLIWLNECFIIKGKYFLLKNWLKSGFVFIKDLFDSDGKWLPETVVKDRLYDKSNWMCEYLTVKKAVSKLCKEFDLYKAQFINIKKNLIILNMGTLDVF